MGGLTGLRALAVLAVLGYHLVPGAVPGGFIGVDVFFVVSGFIVTHLLLRERERTGRIAFGAFWLRRARRILPALAAMIGVCVPLALAVDPRLLGDLRRQLIGAATFSSNWLAIAADGDYFHSDRPDLFTNLWSLAVEEQFYLLGPVVLVLGLAVLRARRRAIVIAALVLAAASAVAMAVLSGSPTRAYFGTDTHAFGLLLGVALAVALGVAPLPGASGRRAVPRVLVAVAALGVLVALTALLPGSSPLGARGGLLLASLAAAALVWAAATTPALGRVIDVAPLAWLGARSYAIYLWHWPLLLILGATPVGADPVLRAILTAVLSVAAAALSFVLIETPLRSVRAPGAAVRLPGRRLVPPVAVLSALVLCSGAIAVARDDTSAAEAMVARGLAALRSASSAPSSTITAPPEPTASPTAVPATATPSAPPPVLGTDITAIGDSVMLASAPELQTALPGIAIDAKVSRSMWAAADILTQLANSGALRPIVVLGLATNGEVGADQLGRVLGIIGPDRTLVLVNAHARRGWIPGANATLTAVADATANVVVADWDSAITPYPQDLADDGIHPQPPGGDIYAATVVAAIQQARVEVAEVQAAQARAAAEAAQKAERLATQEPRDRSPRP
ncbi:acyltransferase family protein [Microbacterium sp. p3-SID336]|uniref:acyltransferase family protein n=1 Tax=Microbacterium sp. p3-SID336 TaxID=2916212 RepID=UPI0021A4B3CF|nr:acyltransferase family protein [Microbacterium sp. p3-SID336]MCT1479170.1 acyltransferase family protein [Microbacterium sp. p3-SID336]